MRDYLRKIFVEDYHKQSSESIKVMAVTAADTLVRSKDLRISRVRLWIIWRTVTKLTVAYY